VQGRFHPAPNVSPTSPLDRFLGLLVGLGLVAVAVCAVAAGLVGWIVLMVAAAAWAAHAAALLAVLLLVAMAGFALAVCAALLWSVLQIGSVRRALGLR
jgi:hypothetical protein